MTSSLIVPLLATAEVAAVLAAATSATTTAIATMAKITRYVVGRAPVSIWTVQHREPAGSVPCHPFGTGTGAQSCQLACRAASIAAMSILPIVIIASKTRWASSPPSANASVSALGVICQERPQRSLHHPQALS